MNRSITLYGVAALIVVLVGCAEESAVDLPDKIVDSPAQVVQAKNPEVAPSTDEAPTSESFFVVDHYDPERSPQEDLKSTAELAANSGKRILIEVGGKW